MPFVLDTQETKTIVAVDQKISDFALDLLKMNADIGYQKRDADGNPVSEHLLSLDAVGTPALIARIQELVDAGDTVYDAIKKAMHESIAVYEGKTGSVV